MKAVTITDESLVEAAGAIPAALAAGFCPTLPRSTLVYLGFALSADDELWESVERNWALEVASGPPLAHVETIFLATIRAMPEADKVALRNRLFDQRARELAE